MKKNIADSIININAKNGKLNMIHMIFRLKIYGGKGYEKKRKSFSASACHGSDSKQRTGNGSGGRGIRPQDGTTKEQPFLSGTGGSSQFRIPCLVSLDDGTIVQGVTPDGIRAETAVVWIRSCPGQQTKEKHGIILLQIISEITGMHGITIRQHLLILQWRQTEKEYI